MGLQIQKRSVAVTISFSALALLAACGTDTHRIGAAGSATTTSVASPSMTTTTIVESTTTTPAPPAFRTVDWGDVTVPGSVCHASQPIQLSMGNATIATPSGVKAGTSKVDISEWSSVVYGALDGTNIDAAALNVFCSNTGGTAEGEVQNSWVIFADHAGTLRTLTTLTPQQPSTAGTHVAIFDTEPGGITIQPGKITAKEAWYGPEDATCCASGQATTVWTVSGSSFAPQTTIGAYPKGS